MFAAATQRAPRRPTGPPPFLLRFAAVLAVPVTLYALYATGVKAMENYQLVLQADQLRTDVVRLRDENVSLQAQIVVSRSDPAIESIARQELGLVKPGDRALSLNTPGLRARATAVAPAPLVSPAAPLARWWSYFFAPEAGASFRPR
jgi:cell division protein FtsB